MIATNHEYLTYLVSLTVVAAVASSLTWWLSHWYNLKQRLLKEDATDLKRQEAWLRSLVQNASDIITVVTADDTINYTSDSIERILGYQSVAWLGKKVSQLVHLEDLPTVEQFLQDAHSAPKTGVVTELRVQHVDGSWQMFEVIAHNLLGEPGVAGMVMTYHNITRRKQREDRLRMLESVVIHAKDAVIITEAEPIDLPGPRIVYVNQSFTCVTGYLPEEVIGKTPRLLQGAGSDRATLNRIRTALKQWQPIVVDILNYRKDGSEFWAELSIVPVADETGWFTHWIAIQREATERKRAEAEMRNALEKEKELRELKSQFVSMASHEFRTPLATIQASSDMLKSFGHKMSEEKKLERLSKIQVEVKHITRLLDDVLLIGKTEAGCVVFDPVPLDLKDFCQDILDEISLTISDRHSLSFTYQGESFLAEADEKLLRQILNNLLSNAVKYSPDGGEISLQLQCTDTTILFQVQDTGLGIPAAEQSRLFEPFHRASNIGNIPGTGLGMAIVKHSAELHGGKISVASQVGSGSKFTVVIPRIHPIGSST